MMTLTRRRNGVGAMFLALNFVALVVILAPNIFSGSTRLWAQEAADAGRKTVTRTPAQYPTLARSMNIRGTVKVEALVAPNGTVRTAEVKGGHPVLAQAALSAVRSWKWEPAAHETREVINIKFDPE